MLASFHLRITLHSSFRPMDAKRRRRAGVGWVWAAGSDTVGAAMSGSYGTLGVPSATNLPGGRSGALSWTDQQGQFWLMGGLGYDSGGNYGYLNDLWKFNVTTKQWTWIGGSSSVPEFLGVTGVLGIWAARRARIFQEAGRTLQVGLTQVATFGSLGATDTIPRERSVI